MPFIHAQNHPARPATVVTATTRPSKPVIDSAPPTVFRLPPFPHEDESAAVLSWGRELGRFILGVLSVGEDHAHSDKMRSFEESGGECLVDLGQLNLNVTQLRLIFAGIISGFGSVRVLSTSTIVIDTQLTPGEVNQAIEVELALGWGTEIARDLTDARANQLSPIEFARRAESLATEHALGFRMWTADDLATEGFGGITAIGQGSTRPPVLVELWITEPARRHSETEGLPAGANASPSCEPPSGALAIAGKGITFDTGGLSLKLPEAMYSMHTDCAGAAAVLGAMVALAITGSSTAIHAVLPLAENVPGPDSVLPGDVVTLRDGTGLEIVDTDFEGRVVLADALSLISEYGPRAVVSLATLTYQATIALGPDIGAVFGRDQEFATELLSAANIAGEEVWPLPWATRYADQIRSSAPGATLRNHPRADTGRAITAALLLGEFVDPSVPFAHIDFGGPAVRHETGSVRATGWGVRTVYELAFSDRHPASRNANQSRLAKVAQCVRTLHTE